jgi:hypothetical protein
MIVDQLMKIREVLERELGETAGKYPDGTPAIKIVPPLPPRKHEGIGIFIYAAPSFLDSGPKLNYQVSSRICFDLVVRQKDQTAEGVIQFLSACEVIHQHFPDSSRSNLNRERSRYEQDDERDLTELFRLKFNWIQNTCLEAITR